MKHLTLSLSCALAFAGTAHAGPLTDAAQRAMPMPLAMKHMLDLAPTLALKAPDEWQTQLSPSKVDVTKPLLERLETTNPRYAACASDVCIWDTLEHDMYLTSVSMLAGYPDIFAVDAKPSLAALEALMPAGKAPLDAYYSTPIPKIAEALGPVLKQLNKQGASK